MLATVQTEDWGADPLRAMQAHYRGVRERTLKASIAAEMERKRSDEERIAALIEQRRQLEEERATREAEIAARQRAIAQLARDVCRNAPILTQSDVIRMVKDAVAKKHGLTVKDMLSRRRWPALVEARHEAIWHISCLTLMSIQSVGRAMGGMDHTSVMFAMRKLAGRGWMRYQPGEPCYPELPGFIDPRIFADKPLDDSMGQALA